MRCRNKFFKTRQSMSLPVAYWAAWADALPVISARAPDFARRCLAALKSRSGETACFREAAAARDCLQQEGWRDCPALELSPAKHAPRIGRPRKPRGLAIWLADARFAHVQHLLSRTPATVLPDMSPSSQALLRPQVGPQAGAWLAAIPTEPATTLPPAAMQIALRCRLRLPCEGVPAARIIAPRLTEDHHPRQRRQRHQFEPWVRCSCRCFRRPRVGLPSHGPAGQAWF